jgi:hypothetical protein
VVVVLAPFEQRCVTSNGVVFVAGEASPPGSSARISPRNCLFDANKPAWEQLQSGEGIAA